LNFFFLFTQLLAIVRAHISALGGNMMVAFYMTELVLIDNPHKNQSRSAAMPFTAPS
jgi:hypothetical protein